MNKDTDSAQYYKMNMADIHIKKLRNRFYYFCEYKIGSVAQRYNKWMALNFIPHLDNYHRIKSAPKQIPIPLKHSIK